MLWKQVRELNARYDQRQKSLQKEYLEVLLELQSECGHKNITRWEYKVDTTGEVASTSEGILIQYRECLDCGKIDSRTNEINNYNSEIIF